MGCATDAEMSDITLQKQQSNLEMRIAKVKIENFRGIKKADLLLQSHSVLVGDNNTGKSTVLEAIDLVLGPERLSRSPVVDEHDFYAGQYISAESQPIEIKVEVILIDLNTDQESHFKDNFEYYDTTTNDLILGPPPEQTDEQGVVKALRVLFKGWYNEEEDDFVGKTLFASPPADEQRDLEPFRTPDKRICGFLFLRTLRTGTRALSLEKGSLLDIILRLKELRPQMWEEVLKQLRAVTVAEDPLLGITNILESVHTSARAFVTAEWVDKPQMFVSNLTRAELRRVLTVFIGTGAKDSAGKHYAAPFHHQGTGTINMLVLSLLVMIADIKQNVIFAMEEPEIAIPPHAQKRIIGRVTSKASQAIFTSHSPYVLEEFKPEHVLVAKREAGLLTIVPAGFPPTVKPKKYREEFKKRYCEALLAKRVLIVEGRTEFDVFTMVARYHHELDPDLYASLEALGIAVIDAEGDAEVQKLGKFFKDLGKEVFAVFDRQSETRSAEIALHVHHIFESPELTFEKLVIDGTAEAALRRYSATILADGDWPTDLSNRRPEPTMPISDLRDVLKIYLKRAKGQGTMADLLVQSTAEETPPFILDTLSAIKRLVEGEEEAANEPVTTASTGHAPDGNESTAEEAKEPAGIETLAQDGQPDK